MKWKGLAKKGFFYTTFIFTFVVLMSLVNDSFSHVYVHPDASSKDSLNYTINELSERLLLSVKTEDSTGSIRKELKSIPLDSLIRTLNTDDKKNAFWVNMYNAYYQILYTDFDLRSPAIYKASLIEISELQLTLDDIEHGILRRYRHKYSLGYLPQLFVSKNIKQLAVSEVDYRIHFALNCGAKSCPAIAFYSSDKINSQLDLSAKSFISQETTIDSVTNEVHVSKLFSWFRADFGGKSGTKEIINKYLGVSVNDYKLSYNEYDWTESMENYDESRFE